MTMEMIMVDQVSATAARLSKRHWQDHTGNIIAGNKQGKQQKKSESPEAISHSFQHTSGGSSAGYYEHSEDCSKYTLPPTMVSLLPEATPLVGGTQVGDLWVEMRQLARIIALYTRSPSYDEPVDSSEDIFRGWVGIQLTRTDPHSTETHQVPTGILVFTASHPCHFVPDDIFFDATGVEKKARYNAVHLIHRKTPRSTSWYCYPALNNFYIDDMVLAYWQLTD